MLGQPQSPRRDVPSLVVRHGWQWHRFPPSRVASVAAGWGPGHMFTLPGPWPQENSVVWKEAEWHCTPPLPHLSGPLFLLLQGCGLGWGCVQVAQETTCERPAPCLAQANLPCSVSLPAFSWAGLLCFVSDLASVASCWVTLCSHPVPLLLPEGWGCWLFCLLPVARSRQFARSPSCG